MKLDIPLDSAFTITFDPKLNALSITGQKKPGQTWGYATSCHVWNEVDRQDSSQHVVGSVISSKRTLPFAVAQIGNLFTRKLTFAATLTGVCFLGFMYARHSGLSAHPALQEPLAAQQASSSLKLPSPTSVAGIPSAATASPNAPFGLD